MINRAWILSIGKRLLRSLDRFLGIMALVLVWVSIGLFLTHNVADAIYFLVAAVLLNQKGRIGI